MLSRKLKRYPRMMIMLLKYSISRKHTESEPLVELNHSNSLSKMSHSVSSMVIVSDS
jgi:hypothetical protein